MNRVERFKQLRNLRRRYLFAGLVFIFLLIAGISTADYSINGLIGEKKGLNILSVKNDGPFLNIVLMNQKIRINVEYVKRDLENLKRLVPGT